MRQAFSLLELLIAAVVAAVCLVPLSRGLSAQAVAAHRAQEISSGYAAVLCARSAKLSDYYRDPRASSSAHSRLWQSNSSQDAGSMRLFRVEDEG
jgi:prepilin-type N-terminal cleavage/methylation domain-containing protein